MSGCAHHRVAESEAPSLETYLLSGGDLIPNNRKLPLLVYRHVLKSECTDGEIEHLFQTNGWGGSWINGIYDFHHYHSTAHEVLGITSGEAKVQFGGPTGPVLHLEAGDVVALPAGTGHCRLDGSNLSVVGAYPKGQEWDICRACAEDLQRAIENIPWVPLPEQDPVYGAKGPLLEMWME